MHINLYREKSRLTLISKKAAHAFFFNPSINPFNEFVNVQELAKAALQFLVQAPGHSYFIAFPLYQIHHKISTNLFSAQTFYLDSSLPILFSALKLQTNKEKGKISVQLSKA